ncbi:MAG: beta-ACP synthase, partial [Pseudomonadales bacterium]
PFAGTVSDVRSLQIAAEGAFREAQCAPQDIDYVSAHGSGTRLNDAKETHFLKILLGDHARKVPVSGIKSMLGHAQGAASSLEAIACVLSLQHDVLYPTMNLTTPDPECDLDYIPDEARHCRVQTVLSNAFGLGGTNALVIFRRWTVQ